MKNAVQYLPLLFLFLLSCKDDDAQPELPPATQTGERTFGAYVNGEVWVPKGRPHMFQSSLSVIYDSGYAGGSLEIEAYKIENNYEESIYIYMSNLNREGMYNLEDPETGASFFRSPDCKYVREKDVYREGTLEITRLDMQEGIIAGTFEFTLAKEGCDTIRVTDGRFDYRL